MFFSKPKSKDGAERLLPKWYILDYQLQNNEFLTMTSQSEWSFDSRYYGPVYTGQIKGALVPIWLKFQKTHQKNPSNKKII